MRKTQGKIYIGTSGWTYSHWKGIFYPQKLFLKEKLQYYSRFFNTTEVNYSFYHLPSRKCCEDWYKETPDNFLFSLKASRFITHIKRLKGVHSAWKMFLNNALRLKEKLGPILFQFSSRFKADKENVRRLEKFLFFIRKNNKKIKIAFEFRSDTWFNKKIYMIFKKYKAGWVIADSAVYPKSEETTADFVYFRMHGPKSLFSSKYSLRELQVLAEKIKRYQKGKDVFVYFNNDACGYAVENAKTLKNLVL